MPIYKVLAEEIDGTELPFPTEILFAASNEVFTPTTSTTSNPANTAVTTQTAIVNSHAINNTLFLQATAQVSTAGTAFIVDTPFSIVPPIGTWVIWYTSDAETTGVNCQGDVELFVDGVGAGETIRSVQNSTAILGLLSLSTATVQATVSFVERYTFNGAQTLTVRYRVNPATSGAGSLQLNARTMLLMQVSQ